jgi:hypothetical protein
MADATHGRRNNMGNAPQEHTGCGHRGRTGRRTGWIFVAFALMAVVLLWQEHRAHILGVIPYVILFSCPLMHLVHRHRHKPTKAREEDHRA